MANDFEVQVETTATPDAAWQLAGDPGRIGEWFAPVVSVTIDGDVRRATMANGAEIVEQLVDRDDAARRYSYVVTSGIPGLTSHKATIRVAEGGAGALIAWRQTATSDDPDYDIEARLRKVMTRGLESLRDHLVSAS